MYVCVCTKYANCVICSAYHSIYSCVSCVVQPPPPPPQRDVGNRYTVRFFTLKNFFQIKLLFPLVSQKRELDPSPSIRNGVSWLADQCRQSGMRVGGEDRWVMYRDQEKRIIQIGRKTPTLQIGEYRCRYTGLSSTFCTPDLLYSGPFIAGPLRPDLSRPDLSSPDLLRPDLSRPDVL